MKKGIVVMVAAAGASVFGITFAPSSTEVVVPADAPKVVRYAAAELTNYLSRAFGSLVPVVAAPHSGTSRIYLGDCAASRSAGIDPARIKRDGFRIKAVGDGVVVVGMDDPSVDPAERLEVKTYLYDLFERGTLNGVYGFLERFAGVRIYFPGELGTIVPKLKSLAVPDGFDQTVEPAFERRQALLGPSEARWFDGTSGRALERLKRRFNYWQRMGTAPNTGAHGLRYFRYVSRFRDTYPEYFIMDEKGDRVPFDTGHAPFWKNGKLCHTSGVWNEVYEDVKAYLTGADAESRGIRNRAPNSDEMVFRWGQNCLETREGKFVNVMPEDGFRPCRCAACQAAYSTDDKKNYATELIWGHVARLARRLRDEGIAGSLCMAAYAPYGRIPDFDLPDNLRVEVAVVGPFAVCSEERFAKDVAEVRRWTEKIGRKVELLIYPGKYSFANKSPDVPHSAPRAYGKFFNAVAPYVCGVKSYPRTDRWLYNYLSLYVYSKLCWDPTLDVEPILNEHDRLMFGAAAKPMGEFFRLVEERWINHMHGPLAEDSLGAFFAQPGKKQMWEVAYSPEVFGRIDALLAAAKCAVQEGSLESLRIDLVRREFVEPARALALRYVKSR